MRLILLFAASGMFTACTGNAPIIISAGHITDRIFSQIDMGQKFDLIKDRVDHWTKVCHTKIANIPANFHDLSLGVGNIFGEFSFKESLQIIQMPPMQPK